MVDTVIMKKPKPRIGMKKDESTYVPISWSLAPTESPSIHSPCSSPPVGAEDCSEEIDLIEETILTCAVCQDTYSDPRILPCLHSFCKGCLSKLASISTSVKCPLCRNEHTLSPKGVDELLPNTQLARKVENLSTTTEISKCNQCEETNVVSFCSNCESYLCESCDGAHKKMLVFKSHVLVLPKLAKKNPKVKSFMCPKHTSEALSVYCINCESVICRDCGLYDHNGHKFKPAVEASDEIRKSLVSNSKQLTTKLKTFRSHFEEIGKVEKHVTVYPDTMKSFITSQFEELHKLLDKRKEVLLQQVDAQYNSFSKTLWVEKDTVETGICKLEAGIKFAEQLAKSDDKLEVAVLGTKAVESMEQVTETLSWNPKNIENISPLVYAAQEGGDTDRGYIEGIGAVKNIEIVITDGDYMHTYISPYPQPEPCNNYFQRNGNYCVEIEIKADHHFKIVFPQMSLLCSCKRGNDTISCTTEHKSDKWKVTFQTKYAGSYTIEAVLKVNGKNCCKKFKNIEFPYESIPTIQAVNSSTFSVDSPSLAPQPINTTGISLHNPYYSSISKPNTFSAVPTSFQQPTIPCANKEFDLMPAEPSPSPPLCLPTVVPCPRSSPPLPVVYSIPSEPSPSPPLCLPTVVPCPRSSPPLPVVYGIASEPSSSPPRYLPAVPPLPVVYTCSIPSEPSPSPPRPLPAVVPYSSSSAPLPVVYSIPSEPSPSPPRPLPAVVPYSRSSAPLPVVYSIPSEPSPSPPRPLPAESKTVATTFKTYAVQEKKKEKRSNVHMKSVSDTQPLCWPLYNTEKKKRGKFQWS